jgi:hypothetical protein
LSCDNSTHPDFPKFIQDRLSKMLFNFAILWLPEASLR